MMNKDYEIKSSGSGLIPGFLAGALLTGALSILIYKKDKGKTFEEIINKIEKLIHDYTNSNSDTKPSKKAVEIPQEVLNSAPETKDTINQSIKTSKPKTFLKPKK